MDFHNFYCFSVPGVSKKSHKMVKECGMHGSECNLEQNFYWRTGRKVSIPKAFV